MKIIFPKNTCGVCRSLKSVYICSRFERRVVLEGRYAGEFEKVGKFGVRDKSSKYFKKGLDYLKRCLPLQPLKTKEFKEVMEVQKKEKNRIFLLVV